MSKVEYEMPQDYQERVARLLEMIETQKFYEKELKFLQSWINLDEAKVYKANLDKSIEEFEAVLAQEYEAYQIFKAAEADLIEYDEMVERNLKAMFIYFKHRQPDKLEKLKNTLLAGYSPEKLEKFYDGVAVLEATKLEEIIAQAEPSALKNF